MIDCDTISLEDAARYLRLAPSTLRKRAAAAGLKRYFTGEPCLHGHVAERFTRNGFCVVCSAASGIAWASRNRDRLRHNQAVYRAKNRAKLRARDRIRKGVPAPTRPAPLVCELCGKPGGLQPDHCHETGAFRGWLCIGCNTGLGKLGDNVSGLMLALQYLQRRAE